MYVFEYLSISPIHHLDFAKEQTNQGEFLAEGRKIVSRNSYKSHDLIPGLSVKSVVNLIPTTLLVVLSIAIEDNSFNIMTIA